MSQSHALVFPAADEEGSPVPGQASATAFQLGLECDDAGDLAVRPRVGTWSVAELSVDFDMGDAAMGIWGTGALPEIPASPTEGISGAAFDDVL